MIIYPHKFPEYKDNDLKTQVQLQAEAARKTHRKIVYECYVGFGKTKMGILALKQYIRSFHVLNTGVIICPGSLKGMWQDIVNDLMEFDSPEVLVMTVNEYTMKDKEKQWNIDFLIVDEAHLILNKHSQWFSTVLSRTETNDIVLMSGSLSDEHKSFLKKHNIDTFFKISKLWGYKNNLIPQYTIVNIPVELTLQEKSEYARLQREFEEHERTLITGGIYDLYQPINDVDEDGNKVIHHKILNAAKDLGWEPGQVIGKIFKWQGVVRDRKNILYNAVNKVVLTDTILKLLDEQVFIFCMTTDFADRIAMRNKSTAVTVHSKNNKKTNDKAMLLFETGTMPHLISIGKLKQGINVPKCRLAVRTAYYGKKEDTEQVGGRIIRLDEDNPDKEAFLINFAVKPFEAAGRKFQSQEEKWLKASLESEHNVVHCKTTEEGIQYIKQTINREYE